MAHICIMNAVIKGYHEFQIRPPASLTLTVMKELGNKFDAKACLVWIPELETIPKQLRCAVTDAKRGETLETIVGLPIGRVPRGLSACFWELMTSFPEVEAIQCQQTGDPCASFPPWLEIHSPGGGAVIPCTYNVLLKQVSSPSKSLHYINTAVLNMQEKTVLKVHVIN
ncbi:hypothetical protein QZH41_017770 [Actinostola sp. cb2023]|nr:hypothetical protein QZH41_017770 [Actinostola sp. cb2023]